MSKFNTANFCILFLNYVFRFWALHKTWTKSQVHCSWKCQKLNWRHVYHVTWWVLNWFSSKILCLDCFNQKVGSRLVFSLKLTIHLGLSQRMCWELFVHLAVTCLTLILPTRFLPLLSRRALFLNPVSSLPLFFPSCCYCIFSLDIALFVSFPQLLERLGQDIPGHLHPNSAGCPEDSSQNHRHCGDTLHIQGPALQVRISSL